MNILKNMIRFIAKTVKRAFGEIVVIFFVFIFGYICLKTWGVLDNHVSSTILKITLQLGCVSFFLLVTIRLWRHRKLFIPRTWIDDTISEVIKKVESGTFINRSRLLSLFTQQLDKKNPDFNILGIHGIGGIGKSRLVRQYQIICHTKKVPLAVIYGAATLGKITFLEELYTQLHSVFQLHNFSKELDRYRKIQQKLREDIDPSKAELPTLIKLLVAGGAIIPTIKPLVSAIGQENVESILSGVYSKLKKPEIELLLDPEPHLTQAFVEDLNRSLTQNVRLVVFIDSLDEIRGLENWLRDQFIFKISSNALFVIASRNSLSLNWGYTNVHREVLSPISHKDSKDLLRILGIKRTNIVDEIADFAEGLPLALILAAELAARIQADKFYQLPKTKELVNPLISELTKLAPPELMQSLEIAALVEWFDADLLLYVLENKEKVRESYQQLQSLEFVDENKSGQLILHPIVKKYILEEMIRRSPFMLGQLHTKIADWFSILAQKKKLFAPDWQLTMLKSHEHRLRADEDSGLIEILQLFDFAYQNYTFDFCENIVDMLGGFSLSTENNAQYLLLRIRLLEIYHDWSNMGKYLNQIGNDKTLPLEIQARIGVYFGRYLWRTQQWNLAEEKLKVTLSLLKQVDNKPLMATAFHALGDTYRSQGRYQEALTSCLNSVELWEVLDDSFGLANGLMNLGLTYRNIRHFDEAIQTFERCINIVQRLETKSLQGKALYLLAGTYLEKGEIQLAKEHLSTSVALLEQQEQSEEVMDDLAIALRELGSIFILEKNFKEAQDVIQRSSYLAESANNHLSIILANLSLSHSYFLTGSLNESRNLAKKANLLAKEHGFPSIVAESEIHLAFNALKLGDRESAQDSIKNALEIVLAMEKSIIQRLEAQIMHMISLQDNQWTEMKELLSYALSWLYSRDASQNRSLLTASLIRIKEESEG